MAGAHLIELDGASVSLKGEMVSLTGLWKAAGSQPNRDPAQWLRSADAERFIAVLAEIEMVDMGNSHNGLIKTTKGGKGGGVTWAHWQIALAYAKYLSSEFHVHCNTVIRAHMERRHTAPTDFPADLLEMVKRTDGIVRMLAHKVTTIEKAMTALGSTPAEPEGFTITVTPTKRSAA